MKKQIGNVISVLAGATAGAVAGGATIGRIMGKRADDKNDLFKKVLSYYYLYERWLEIRQQGKSLVDFFEKNGYKSVAIYGYKELGESLYKELKDSDITVKYIIDKNADAIYTDVDVVTPDDYLETVDVIVVTATYYFGEIEEVLAQKTDYPVISLEDVIYEV